MTRLAIRFIISLALFALLVVALVGVPALFGFMWGGGRATTAWATAISAFGVSYAFHLIAENRQ